MRRLLLFDVLANYSKHRELVTTLETGELKGAWADNRADVAIPEAKCTLQDTVAPPIRVFDRTQRVRA
ncbi:MAG: hypothetical protein ING75_00005 [Rhodocyclaceae bacterium]|nr:hypothetical protein [Rhodocyclaceae bacterium]